MGRGPRNQSRPIGPDTVGPRAGRAPGPRPTLAGTRGPRHRRSRPAPRQAWWAPRRACCLPWAVCSSAPAHSAAELPRLATGASCTVASTRALAAAPCLRVSEAGQTMSLSVYQCEGPCLLRPAPRRPAPTRGIGPAGHRTVKDYLLKKSGFVAARMSGPSAPAAQL